MEQPNPAERWVPIPGYEGYYEASDLGQIRSLDRLVRGGRGTCLRLIRGHVLKQTVEVSGGRRTVSLGRDGKWRTLRVHCLVLTAFRGARPRGMVGCHNNGNVSDNRLENLRWDTPSENMHDEVRHGTHVMAARTHCPRRHQLTAPNLVPSGLVHGHRSCLACSRTHANEKRAKRRGEVFDFQAAADAHYKRIMGGVTVSPVSAA